MLGSLDCIALDCLALDCIDEGDELVVAVGVWVYGGDDYYILTYIHIVCMWGITVGSDRIRSDQRWTISIMPTVHTYIRTYIL